MVLAALKAPKIVVVAAALLTAGAGYLVYSYVASDPMEYDFRRLQSERDPNSRVQWVNDRVRLRFRALAGRSYSVQYALELPASAWLKLQDVFGGAGSGLVEVDDPNATQTRFYRIVTPAAP